MQYTPGVGAGYTDRQTRAAPAGAGSPGAFGNMLPNIRQPKETPPQGKVYGLTRASTRRQEASPEVQADQIRQHCAAAELGEPVMLDEPLGTSAKIPFAERQQGRWLREHARPGDTLIVTKLDRLGRNLRDLLETIDYLTNRQVRLIVLQFFGGNVLDLNSAFGRVMVNIVGAFAQFERDMIGERIRDGQRWRRERGLLVSRLPFGFRAVVLPLRPGENKGLKQAIPVDPAIVEEIVARIDRQGHRLYAIARDFHARGLTCRGVPWCPLRRRAKKDIETERIKRAYLFWRNHPLRNAAIIAKAASETDAGDALLSGDGQLPAPGPSLPGLSGPPSPCPSPPRP